MKSIAITLFVALLSSTWLVGCSSNPTSSVGAKQAQSNQSQDGDILIPLTSVPQAALDAVTAAQPGGTIIGAEREDEKGVTVYELQVRQPNGTVIEVETDAQGTILGTEAQEKENTRPGSAVIGN